VPAFEVISLAGAREMTSKAGTSALTQPLLLKTTQPHQSHFAALAPMFVKARLVACGFTDRHPHIDSSAPTLSLDSLRLFLSCISELGKLGVKFGRCTRLDICMILHLPA